MPFVQILHYYVNLDHIISVQDTGTHLAVTFNNGDKPTSLSIEKNSQQGIVLMQLVRTHTA